MAIRSFFSQVKAKVKRGLANINKKKIYPDPFKRQLGPKSWIEVVVPEQNSELASYRSNTLVDRSEPQRIIYGEKHTNKCRLSVNTASFRNPFYATQNVEQRPPMPVQLPELFQPPMPAQPPKLSELPKLPKLSMPAQLPKLPGLPIPTQPHMPAQPPKLPELPKFPKLSMPAQLPKLPELPMPTQPPKHTQLLSHELFVLHQIEPQDNDITLRQLLLNRAKFLGDKESGWFPETWHEEHPAPCCSRIEDAVLFYCPEFEHPSANPQTQSCAMGGPIILNTPPDIVKVQG